MNQIDRNKVNSLINEGNAAKSAGQLSIAHKCFTEAWEMTGDPILRRWALEVDMKMQAAKA